MQVSLDCPAASSEDNLHGGLPNYHVAAHHDHDFSAIFRQ
jgi:hypothetical protein